MNYMTCAYTDVGIKKNTNQDSYSVQVARANGEYVAMAIICDGMGGLAKGEVASSYVINQFKMWFKLELSRIINAASFDTIEGQWNSIVQSSNEIIKKYGDRYAVAMGTTLTVALFYKNKCYVMHVGDSRLYCIGDNGLKVLTQDQTWVANEVRHGRMTIEEAERDPRRNVLLQCIGASKNVIPDYCELDIKKDQVYMLCSDGFRHKLLPQEIINCFAPSVLINKERMLNNSKYLVDLNKSRKETDNITALLIKTY